MSNDTIRVTGETKDVLEDIKQHYYEHTTLTYSEAVEVLVAEYKGSADGDGSDTTSDQTVTKRSASDTSGEDTSSDEVEEKINSVRISDGGGTRNNERLDGDDESFRGDDEDEVADLSPEELDAMEK